MKIFASCTVFICFILILNANAQTRKVPIVKELNSDWTFRLAAHPDTTNAPVTNSWKPAKVPGTVHTDLLANKLIDDPYYKDNERRQQWIERCDWEYQTTFNLSPEMRKMEMNDLILDGIDTYAKVYINDSLVLTANNMFIGYQIAIKKYLKPGNNILRIYFPSPVLEGLSRLKANNYAVPAHNELAPSLERSSVFLRKAPYHYGWDWGPRFVTCGIWQPVKIKAWNRLQIDDFFVQQRKLGKTSAQLTAKVEIASTTAQDVSIEIMAAKKVVGRKTLNLIPGLNKVNVDFSIADPKLWWPHGLGDPYLYSITCTVLSNSQMCDSVSQNIGLRTIEWVQQPDSIGTSFYAKVNGIPVFMKGANYIPADNFITAVTRQRYEKVIKGAVEANMNMLRVWGGGVYETEQFYDLCDQNGLLVWQDFMFACSMIPPGKDHLDNLEQEFIYNVRRLRKHPSTAIYCGNNENMVGWFNWNWKSQYKYSSKDSTEIIETYKKVMHDMLPSVIAKHDSGSFYWPSSPSSGPTYTDLPNNKSGDQHDWQVWFQNKPYDDYKKTAARFVSEYGMQSFPEMRTIKSFSDSTDWAYRSPLFEFKQRSQLAWIAPGMNGNGMIGEYVKKYYRWPKNFENFVYVSQLNQALCYKTAVETHRRKMPYCMGSLYWQLDDCWPTVSWSSMDYYYRWKASHYALKKAYEPLIISVDTTAERLHVYAVSDKLTPYKCLLRLQLKDFKGSVLWTSEKNITVAPNTSKIYLQYSIKEIIKEHSKGKVVLVVSLIDGDKELAINVFYFVNPKDLELASEKPKIAFLKMAGGYIINITSDAFLKDVYLETATDGFFSDNFFDVFPGKVVTLKFTAARAGEALQKVTAKSLVDTY